jgi:hypothetical protein
VTVNSDLSLEITKSKRNEMSSLATLQGSVGEDKNNHRVAREEGEKDAPLKL